MEKKTFDSYGFEIEVDGVSRVSASLIKTQIVAMLDVLMKVHADLGYPEVNYKVKEIR